MWQIAEHSLNGRRALSPAAFESNLLAICESHRAQGRALAFALVLFDARHPHLRKVLEDEAYWDALDELSGRNLTVFSLLAYLGDRQPAEAPPRTRWMVGIPQSGSGLSNDILSEYFPELQRESLPCVLFFQVENKALVGSLAVGLRTTAGPSESYNELAEILRTALVSIEQVDDENASNSREIFHLIEAAMRGRALRNGTVAIYRGIRATSPVSAFLRGIFGLL